MTYDDDFVLKVDESEYRAAFYFGNATLPAKRVTDIVHAVTQLYPQEEISGLEYVGEEWL